MHQLQRLHAYFLCLPKTIKAVQLLEETDEIQAQIT